MVPEAGCEADLTVSGSLYQTGKQTCVPVAGFGTFLTAIQTSGVADSGWPIPDCYTDLR